MKNQFLSLFTVILIGLSLTSCAKNEPGINGNGRTIVSGPDQLNYALAVGSTMSSTIAYQASAKRTSSGIPFVLCYNNASYDGNPNNASTQDRKCTMKTISGTPFTAMGDQNVLADAVFAQDVYDLMANIHNIAGNKTALAAYKSKMIPVYVVGFNGAIKGATAFNDETGELGGTLILYEVQPGVEWHTVAEVYGLQ